LEQINIKIADEWFAYVDNRKLHYFQPICFFPSIGTGTWTNSNLKSKLKRTIRLVLIFKKDDSLQKNNNNIKKAII